MSDHHATEPVMSKSKSPPTELKSGIRIHGWKLGKRLGEGGQGDVWEVRSTVSSHTPPRAMKLCTATDAQARQRFEREVATLQKVSHPSIVPHYESNVHWVAAPDTEIVCAYYVTHRYQGTLASVPWWHRAPVYCLSIFDQICDALSYLHDRDPAILHRDLKPDNILFDAKSELGEIAITDLGTVTDDNHEGTPLTKVHEVIGTRCYRAPESQFGRYDARSDVFSLGRILAWMLTGIEPSNPAPPAIPDTHPLSAAARAALNQVLATACAMEPDARYPTVAALRHALPSLEAAVVARTVMATTPVVQTPENTYNTIKDLLAKGNTIGWRDYKKTQRSQVIDALTKWRTKADQSRTATFDHRRELLDDGLTALADPLAFTLASLEAPSVTVPDSEAFQLFPWILDAPLWKSGGLVHVVEEGPLALVATLHALVGSSLAMNDRVAGAVTLTHLKLSSPRRTSKELWRNSYFHTHMPFLASNARVTWPYLCSLPDRHPWLGEVFGSSLDYQIYLAAHQWLLTIVELAHEAPDSHLFKPETKIEDVPMEVLPMMLMMDVDVWQEGFRRMLGHPESLRRILAAMGASEAHVRIAWPRWRELLLHYRCRILPERGSFLFARELPIPDLP